MALIEVDDIADLLGVKLTTNEETVVEYYLDFAKGELEAYLGRPIEVESFTETVVADADGRIYLSDTPVESVSSVTINGEEQSTDFYRVTPWGIELGLTGTSYSSSEFGLDSSYLFDLYDADIVVDYMAGLDTPAAVNSVMAAVVMRAWRDRQSSLQQSEDGHTGIKEIRVEDYAVEYDIGSRNSSYYSGGGNPITMFRHEADFIPVKRFKRRSSG